MDYDGFEVPHSAELHAAFYESLVRGATPDDCDGWAEGKSISTQGYGQFWIPRKHFRPDDINPGVGGKFVRIHRYRYEIEVGPIPPGYTVDHLCHNEDKTCEGLGRDCPHRKCSNPRHLRPETLANNRKAAARPRPSEKHDGSGHRQAKTHCPKDHPYTDENTGWVERRGHRERYCKACNREKVYRAKHGVDRPADWDESLSRAGVEVCHRGHAYDEANTKYDSTTGKRRCRECERINWKASRERARQQE